MLCPRVDDLPSVLHPQALAVGVVRVSQVTLQGDGPGRVQRQQDLISGIDLWFCKTETVSPYRSTGVCVLTVIASAATLLYWGNY